jgi:hypothetical protein
VGEGTAINHRFAEATLQKPALNAVNGSPVRVYEWSGVTLESRHRVNIEKHMPTKSKSTPAAVKTSMRRSRAENASGAKRTPGPASHAGKWRTKLEKGVAKVEALPPEAWAKMGGHTMAIPRPLDVDAEMRTVPKGKLITTTQIRVRLAQKYGSDVTCPLCTGIFVRIAAEAAEEDRALGAAKITPYWRTIKADGKLNEKYPGGVEAQAAQLEAEGHTVSPGRGKQPPKVTDFEKRLVKE